MTTNYIPAELRPVLIERVRQLNADSLFDTEIGRQLGYASDTIRNLRHEADIPAVDRATRPEKFGPTEGDCPVCTLPVQIARSGNVKEHKAFFGRLTRGAVNGTVVQAAERCPASDRPYAELAPVAVAA